MQPPKNKYQQKSLTVIMHALEKTGGFQNKAAEMLGITRAALSMRIKNSQELQDKVLELEEKYLDLAETKLIKALENDQEWAIKYYLDHKGKKRGYGNKIEVSGDTSLTINIVNFSGIIDANNPPK